MRLPHLALATLLLAQAGLSMVAAHETGTCTFGNNACVKEEAWGPRDCSADHAGRDEARAQAGPARAHAEGYEQCGPNTQNGHGLTATVRFGAVFLTAAWVREQGRCEQRVESWAGSFAIGCQTGDPPNPGWGRLLQLQ